MNDLVSVLIPTYGGGVHLERAVDSVLNQTYKNIEVIIIDDNGLGTENQILTQNHMQKYINDNRVKYICHKTNKNGAAARNTGFAHSSGSFIALLDDDDVYVITKIENTLKVLINSNNEYGIAYCSYDKYSMDGRLLEHVEANYSGEMLYILLMHQISLTSGSLVVKREVWNAVNGFDESFKRHQDWEFTARISSKYKVAAVKKTGLIKNMEYRNSPPNIELSKKYRLHYLDKMWPYIRQLTSTQQKNVIVYNRLDIAIQYIKKKQILNFLNEYGEVRPGFTGIKFLLERMVIIIKRKRLIIR